MFPEVGRQKKGASVSSGFDRLEYHDDIIFRVTINSSPRVHAHFFPFIFPPFHPFSRFSFFHFDYDVFPPSYSSSISLSFGSSLFWIEEE